MAGIGRMSIEYSKIPTPWQLSTAPPPELEKVKGIKFLHNFSHFIPFDVVYHGGTWHRKLNIYAPDVWMYKDRRLTDLRVEYNMAMDAWKKAAQYDKELPPKMDIVSDNPYWITRLKRVKFTKMDRLGVCSYHFLLMIYVLRGLEK